jgi:carbamoyltransferase
VHTWCASEVVARGLRDQGILADQRRLGMREIINTKIKFREKFRPLLHQS